MSNDQGTDDGWAKRHHPNLDLLTGDSSPAEHHSFRPTADHDARARRNATVRLAALASGQRFTFLSPDGGWGSMTAREVGVVEGRSRYGVMVLLPERTGKGKRLFRRVDWSGCIYVLPVGEPDSAHLTAPSHIVNLQDEPSEEEDIDL